MVPPVLLPQLQTKSGVIALVNGVATLLLAGTTLERWIFAFAVGNTTCPISLQVTAGSELCRIFAPTSSVQFIIGGRRIAPDAANLTVTAQGVDSPSVSYTLVYADCSRGTIESLPIRLGPG